MPGFTVQRNGFTRTPELAYAIVTDLIAAGLVMKYPLAPLAAPTPGTPYAGFKVTLEPDVTVDPLAATQPWRIVIDTVLDGQQMDVYIATPTQLADDGTVALLDVTDSGGNIKMPAGMLNINGSMTGTLQLLSAIHFIARNYTGRVTDAVTAQAYPMSYALSVTGHGVALMTWEEAADSSSFPHSSWFVVQRPVDHITGVPLTTGHCPVICLFSLVNKPYKFVVREDDVIKPTRPVIADEDTEDSHMIINSQPQVVIAENNRYIVVFPNGINTPRYMYTEELDMLAYTSSDVISHYSDISMTVYGEAVPRVYKAMQSNALNNTGMRVLMVRKGAGIP